MAGLILVAAGLALAGVALGIKTADARRTVAAWERGGRELGLRGMTIQGVFMPRLWGFTDDGVEVAVRRDHSGENTPAHVVLSAVDLLPAGLELRRENLGTAFEKRVKLPDLETGDGTFDARVYVQAPTVMVLAVLDETNRRGIRGLVEAGGRVDLGQLKVSLRGEAAAPRRLGRRVGELIELLRRLRMPLDLPAKLADNARNDPVPGVRRRNLEVLAERFPRQEATAATLQSALEDPDPGVRLAAATGLGEAGLGTLVELAIARNVPELTAVAAVRRAGGALGSERASTLLARGLGERRPELALAAVEALGACGDDAAAKRLGGILDGADSRLAAAAAGALAVCSGAAAELRLIAALARDDRSVRLAAAAALAEVGSVAAVPALRAAVAAHPTDFGLRGAASAAVGAIQARAQGAAPGQLSLAGGGTGELALAEDDDGRLSLIDDESGAGGRQP